MAQSAQARLRGAFDERVGRKTQRVSIRMHTRLHEATPEDVQALQPFTPSGDSASEKTPESSGRSFPKVPISDRTCNARPPNTGAERPVRRTSSRAAAARHRRSGPANGRATKLPAPLKPVEPSCAAVKYSRSNTLFTCANSVRLRQRLEVEPEVEHGVAPVRPGQRRTPHPARARCSRCRGRSFRPP